MPAIILMFVLFLILLIAARMYKGVDDHSRIAEHIASNGGKLIESAWSPFAPGSFGNKSSRAYEIRYLDNTGAEHMAYCRTGRCTGVYLIQDQVVAEAPPLAPAARIEQLEAEIRRMREEIEWIKRASDGQKGGAI